MTNKIVRAVNTMMTNPELITGAIRGMHRNECFFCYNDKYHWSILKSEEGTYYLSYFPSRPPLEQLAQILDDAWEDEGPDSFIYDTIELADPAATDAFASLHTLVSAKAYDIDTVLDDIIVSSPD